MPPFGPQYCETPPSIDGSFPLEPANAISSGVIVLFGIAGLILVMRKAPRAYQLYLMCALLMVNGLGSILWHGLRTRWALDLDVLPALVFIGLGAFLWALKVSRLWQASLLAVALLGAPWLMRTLDLRLPGWGRASMTAIIVALAGIWLVVKTWAISRPAAAAGVSAIVLAFVALAFRSADALACDELGFGSHFLWHIFLSSAAFCLLVTLVRLERKG